MLTEFLTGLVVAAVSSVTLMVVIWRIGVRIRNFGIVDIAWSAGFSVLAVMSSLLSNGYGPRRALITAMAAFWSLRLGAHLYFRVMKHHPIEDSRYAKLREEWGTETNRKMFWFFQLQAGSQVILSAPFLLVCLNPRPGLKLIEWLGFVVWLIALAGESLADPQLKQFKT